jgi:hypothetical protein
MDNFDLIPSWSTGIVFFIMLIPVLILLVITAMIKPKPGEKPNTWKGRTFFFIGVAALFPYWIITAPLYCFLAYRSYKAGGLPNDDGTGRRIIEASVVEVRSGEVTEVGNAASQIAQLHELLKSGALTQDEFDTQKRKVLAS